MLRLNLFLIFSLLSFGCFSQPSYRIFDFIDPSLKSFGFGIRSGGSYYYGDLSRTKDSYKNPSVSVGTFTKLRFNDYFHASLDLNYYRIHASDFIPKRGLSFRSDNFEVLTLGYFEFLNFNSFHRLSRKEFPVSFHMFTGFGFTTNNPKTFYNNKWVELRPLMTENVEYSNIAFVLPVGFGVSYQINKRLLIEINSSYRFTSSDYLDDVSGVYSEPDKLPNDLSRDITHRGTVWLGPNSKRGNPKSKDGYLINSISLEYKLSNKFNRVLFNR